MIGADVAVHDNSAAFLSALRRAQDAGLHAEARAYQRDVKREFRGGTKGYIFKTTVGNKGRIVRGQRRPWYTGLLWNSITIAALERTPAGASIRVGTNVPYALYWELGHHNIFTRHFERDAKWVPTFQRNAAAYGETFQRSFTAMMRTALQAKPADAESA